MWFEISLVIILSWASTWGLSNALSLFWASFFWVSTHQLKPWLPFWTSCNSSDRASTQVPSEAGYPFNNKQEVIAKIDNAQFNFYSEDDTAWTNDDDMVIFAMKKGNKLTVKGVSSRGTKTTDIYTLKGFTAAFNQLQNDC